ncbi:MAG: ribonuclease P [Candidatus Woesearchaeota archaeon]|nr:ribonuclease P [Candidatus Woesearchaeota archaeon]
MKNNKNIALNRIKVLFKQASESFKDHPERSHRYTHLARKISMKTKTKIPSNLKRKFCKHCYKFLQPGANCRVRTKNKKVIYYCLNCKRYMRFPLK